MNVNDMEIVLSVIKNAGYSEVVDDPESAEIIFINTCAIRDNAEHKVWQRLDYFWFLKSDRGHRVSFAKLPIPNRDDNDRERQNPKVGDFVEVRILKSTRATVFGEALATIKLSSFYNNKDEEAVACGSMS